MSQLEPLPKEWLRPTKVRGIVVHWTAGTHLASGLDRSHYHFLIEGDGKCVKGIWSPKDNENCADGKYAAHTLGANTQRLGVALCGMGGAREAPFDAGKWPLRQVQWSVLALVLAQLCKVYEVRVSRESVLSHAEVQGTLGIKQRGKWDISRLPFDPSLVGAHQVGEALRTKTLLKMAEW